MKPLMLSALAERVRRAAAPISIYDWSTFCDRPVEALDAASVSGDRDQGGWRAYAGAAMERRWSDIFTIDVFLARHRPSIIIELGTGSAAFSCYLATYAYMNGAAFHTFDSHRKSAPSKRSNYRALKLVRTLGGKVHHRDIFESSTTALIRGLIASKPPVFLYCDNGDKPREVRTFAPALKPGDFVGVHDYGSEIVAADLEGLAGGALRPWNPALFETLSSSNRIFQRAVMGEER
jgi:hypothetical protein